MQKHKRKTSGFHPKTENQLRFCACERTRYSSAWESDKERTREKERGMPLNVGLSVFANYSHHPSLCLLIDCYVWMIFGCPLRHVKKYVYKCLRTPKLISIGLRMQKYCRDEWYSFCSYTVFVSCNLYLYPIIIILACALCYHAVWD